MNPEASASDELVFVDPDRLDCVLAAADGSELDELRAWCGQLEADAYGQIFVEVDSLVDATPLGAPAGVSVTWVERAPKQLETGRALAVATDAWLDEWFRAGYGPERHVQIWSGARTSAVMREFWQQLEQELTTV